MTSIFEFAIVTAWDGRLANLAAMAEQERWGFLHVPSTVQFPVLDKYLKNTFKRVVEQQKLVESDRLCCFNTGLLTSGQEQTFGVFSNSEHYDRAQPISHQNKKWYFKSWLRAGDREITELLEFPALADYWTDSRDLIFDPKIEVQLNLDHIVRDNLNRFPVELGGCVDQCGVPTDLTEQSSDDELDVESPTANNNIPIRTRNALEGAMKHSIRLAQRSYRIAVPQFYRGKIQLLLPVYLRDEAKPDLALTLERHGGWYRAATVLYPDWAYTHARLLARPNSEWLGGFRDDLDPSRTG